MSKLKYRLALDLGSTSLGWALVRLNNADEPNAIIKSGVRIFSDGRNPKDGSSLAVKHFYLAYKNFQNRGFLEKWHF
jgi:CRISPR-associated endonuclease Csn1